MCPRKRAQIRNIAVNHPAVTLRGARGACSGRYGGHSSRPTNGQPYSSRNGLGPADSPAGGICGASGARPDAGRCRPIGLGPAALCGGLKEPDR
jgi:hypothetical protein